MSGYEVPPPTNTDYFNTLFYYNSQGSGTGGGNVNPATLLSYPTAQGLEYFPAGIDMGNSITFSNTDLTKDIITGVSTITYADTTSQTTAYNATLVGQLAAPNVWTSTTPNQFNAGLKFSSSGATQTAPYDASLVGQLSAGNVWSNTTTPNKFVAGIQFNDNTIQTTAATTTNLLSTNNTWTGTNSFTQIPSTTVVTAPTAQQFVTFAYGNSIYPRLATNNLYQGVNTFDRIAATTCSCDDFTSNTLTCTASIDTPNLTAKDTTLSSTLTLNGTTFYGSSNFSTYYDAANTLPTLVFTSPNFTSSANKSPQFVFTFPGQSHYFVINAGGSSLVQNPYTSSSQAQPANQVVQTDTDVIIRGTSWNDTLATLF